MNKKDAYYFPHFCNARHDRKIKRVIKELGVEGYGIYFMLLEVLREQTDLRYPLDDIDLLADEFGTSEQKVRTVICNYKLFDVDEKQNFFSIKMIFYLQPYFDKSERARNAANIRWSNANVYANVYANALPEHSKSNASKVKESKVNENKIKEIINSDFDNFQKFEKIMNIDLELKLANEYGFNIFWDEYHYITGLSKTDKESAFKYWRKLKKEEQKKAILSIEKYYNSLNDKKYCKKCRTYLSDKNFNDEFEKTEKIKNKFKVKSRLGEIRAYNVETLEEAKELYSKDNGLVPIDEIFQV